MTRSHLGFTCEGSALAATFDHGDGAVGLLIVSGGNEIRSGAFSGQAKLASQIAAAGFPVLRFDRRGIGDSEGENAGYRSSRPDIAAALALLRSRAPQARQIVGFGNCDAATSLALFEGAGCDHLILSNPWTLEDETETAPPPAAIRARYAAKLRNPREIMRLLKGGVDLRKLARGLLAASHKSAPQSPLTEEMSQALAAFPGEVRILLASADRTAQSFLAGWNSDDPRLHSCEGASHSYVENHARLWLSDQIIGFMHALESRPSG